MKTRNNRIALPTTQPRNPLVAAARFRQAGAHRVGRHERRDLDKLHPPHP